MTLPPVEDAGQSAREIAAALDVLQQTRGVTSASLVPPEELEQLIEPWLGNVTDRRRAAAAAADRRHAGPARRARSAGSEEPAAGGRRRSDDRDRGPDSRDRAERDGGVLPRLGGRRRGRHPARRAARGRADHPQSACGRRPRSSSCCAAWARPTATSRASSSATPCCAGLRGGLIGFVLAVLTILALLYSSRADGARRARSSSSCARSTGSCSPACRWSARCWSPAIARMTALRGLAQMS